MQQLPFSNISSIKLSQSEILEKVSVVFSPCGLIIANKKIIYPPFKKKGSETYLHTFQTPTKKFPLLIL